MKKITKILAAAAVLACGMMLTACGAAETIKEIVDSTHRTWYKYSGTTSIEVPLGDDDSTETSSTSKNLKDAEIYIYYDHGLTVAVQSKSTQDIQLFDGLVTKQQEIYIGGTKTYTEQEFGTGKWTALLAAANFKKQSEAPKIVSDKDNCIIIGGDDAANYKIQWKKFLKQKLINALIGDE